MAETKRDNSTAISDLIEEAELIISSGNRNDTEYYKKTMEYYLREKKRLEIISQLKSGYEEMSKLNQEIAESGVLVDGESLTIYEEEYLLEFAGARAW